MRADLLALTPATVTALANVGLVKRAQREIEAGAGPALEEDAAGIVTGRFADGTVTTLPPNVALHAAPCSCGAATICRHRVAVALAYASWSGSAASDEAWSPAEFRDDALASLVGKNALIRAKALRRRGLVAELAGGTLPEARLPTCTVRFHVPHDLAYARCDCQLGVACEHIVVAAWAFRQAQSLPATVALGDDSGTLAPSALALVAHVLEEGIAHVGPAAQPRFARARADLEEQAWPAVLVDELERLAAAYHARSARYRTSDAAFAMVSLAARARACAHEAALPARYLLGSDEAKETALDHVRLVSLGARLEVDGEERIASVYLADPDAGTVLVTARTFDATDTHLARRTITGRVTLGALAHGELVTRAAKRRANQALTLSASRTAQTAVSPSTGAWDALPSGLLVEDRAMLAAGLAARPPRMLRPVTLAAETRVLAIASVKDIAYRHADQELVALVSLKHGGAVLVTRRYGRAAPAALDVLAAALREGPRFIAGDVRLGDGGLELDPIGLVVGERVVVPDLESAPAATERLPPATRDEPTPIHRALATTGAVLEEALHDGLGQLREGFAARVGAAARALADAGLEGARIRLEAFARAPTVDAWLEAALRLELTREALLAAPTTEAG